jgi:hypothetical protein
MSPDAISILRWPSVSNRAYAVEWTTNLASGFGVLASNLPATPAENVYTDAVNRAASQGFYRIRATR